MKITPSIIDIDMVSVALEQEETPEVILSNPYTLTGIPPNHTSDK